jgi:hypothetical protein
VIRGPARSGRSLSDTGPRVGLQVRGRQDPFQLLLDDAPVASAAAAAAAAMAPDVVSNRSVPTPTGGNQDLQQTRLFLVSLGLAVRDPERMGLEIDRPRTSTPASMPARRNNALTRASSVRGLNGLVR